MKKFGGIILLVLTVVLVVVLNNKLGKVPPIGKFFDPFQGFWHNAAPDQLPWPEAADLGGLEAKATVQYDNRGVPHIQAENDHDLYFLQGYVTARDRLWQMELQTYAAGGRVSELIGVKTLEFDRLQRRRGMKLGAQESLKAMTADPETAAILSAYTDGVNAWINSLSKRDYPIEYKLLDYQPEAWTQLKTCLLLKYMADMLTGWSNDFAYTRSLAAFGQDKFDLIYPLFPDSAGLDPIIPRNVNWDFEPVKIDTAETKGLALALPNLPKPDIDPNNGSNNWAVHASKTQNGNPILCGDPHLALNLPAIWYEIQMTAPGINTYGVSLPGSPAIIIGFNQEVAWSVTNASRDVMDWYQVEFKDGGMDEYKHNGKWEKTTSVIEEIKVRGGGIVYDTIYYTQHGPVVYDQSFANENGPQNLAMTWTAHSASAELLTFHKLNRAKNHQDYRKAIAYFECPGQNFVFASREGDVAITQQGKFPVKWPGQGRTVMDANEPLHLWRAFIPQEQNPHVKNPERGFVSSANQLPTDFTYPYDVSGNYETYRNRRINQELSRLSKITVENMMSLQNDNYNMMAAEGLPLMLASLDRSGLDGKEKEMLVKLEAWDYFNHPEMFAPSIYEAWKNALHDAVWSDEIELEAGNLAWPAKYNRVQQLARDTIFGFVDNKNTPETETLAEVVTSSYVEAVEEIVSWEDSLALDCNWGRYKATRIRHIMKISAFDRKTYQIGGNSGIVNACSGTHGPSWRMIVELGDEPKAWGVYPGGPSGNPGSPYYSNTVDQWAEGKYNELPFFKVGQTDHPVLIATQTFSPKTK